MRYGVLNGGKRLRPFLVLQEADCLAWMNTVPAVWVLTIEMVHSYSLIHDDLPAMDDADRRRGKPSFTRPLMMQRPFWPVMHY